MAASAGYASTYHFDDRETFRISVGAIPHDPAPIFISLKIVPEIEYFPTAARDPRRGRSLTETIRDLQALLGIQVE